MRKVDCLVKFEFKIQISMFQKIQMMQQRIRSSTPDGDYHYTTTSIEDPTSKRDSSQRGSDIDYAQRFQRHKEALNARTKVDTSTSKSLGRHSAKQLLIEDQEDQLHQSTLSQRKESSLSNSWKYKRYASSSKAPESSNPYVITSMLTIQDRSGRMGESCEKEGPQQISYISSSYTPERQLITREDVSLRRSREHGTNVNNDFNGLSAIQNKSRDISYGERVIYEGEQQQYGNDTTLNTSNLNDKQLPKQFESSYNIIGGGPGHKHMSFSNIATLDQSNQHETSDFAIKQSCATPNSLKQNEANLRHIENAFTGEINQAAQSNHMIGMSNKQMNYEFDQSHEQMQKNSASLNKVLYMERDERTLQGIKSGRYINTESSPGKPQKTIEDEMNRNDVEIDKVREEQTRGIPASQTSSPGGYMLTSKAPMFNLPLKDIKTYANQPMGTTQTSNGWTQGNDSSHFSRGQETHYLLPTIREVIEESSNPQFTHVVRKEWMPASRHTRLESDDKPISAYGVGTQETNESVKNASLRNRAAFQFIAHPVLNRFEERIHSFRDLGSSIRQKSQDRLENTQLNSNAYNESGTSKLFSNDKLHELYPSIQEPNNLMTTHAFIRSSAPQLEQPDMKSDTKLFHQMSHSLERIKQNGQHVYHPNSSMQNEVSSTLTGGIQFNQMLDKSSDCKYGLESRPSKKSLHQKAPQIMTFQNNTTTLSPANEREEDHQNAYTSTAEEGHYQSSISRPYNNNSSQLNIPDNIISPSRTNEGTVTSGLPNNYFGPQVNQQQYLVNQSSSMVSIPNHNTYDKHSGLQQQMNAEVTQSTTAVQPLGTSATQNLLFLGMQDAVNTNGGLLNNTSSATDNQIAFLKQELYTIKRQLADAQNSFQFIKREKLRIEHDKNLIEIQLKQYEELDQRKQIEEDAKMQQINDIRSKYEEAENQIAILRQQIKQQDHAYKEKLLMIAKQLDNVGERKSKARERLYEVGLQIKSTINNLNDLLRAQKSLPETTTIVTKPLQGLFDQLNSKCDILEELLIATLHPQREQTLKVKCFKRQHNFEKFRKETRELIQRGLTMVNRVDGVEKEFTLNHKNNNEALTQLPVQDQQQEAFGSHIEKQLILQQMQHQQTQIAKLKKELESEKLKNSQLQEQISLSQKQTSAAKQEVKQLQNEMSEMKQNHADKETIWERKMKRESDSLREEIRWLQAQLASTAASAVTAATTQHCTIASHSGWRQNKFNSIVDERHQSRERSKNRHHHHHHREASEEEEVTSELERCCGEPESMSERREHRHHRCSRHHSREQKRKQNCYHRSNSRSHTKSRSRSHSGHPQLRRQQQFESDNNQQMQQLLEERNLLERQIAEYRSTLVNQTHLITALQEQFQIHKQKVSLQKPILTDKNCSSTAQSQALMGMQRQSSQQLWNYHTTGVQGTISAGQHQVSQAMLEGEHSNSYNNFHSINFPEVPPLQQEHLLHPANNNKNLNEEPEMLNQYHDDDLNNLEQQEQLILGSHNNQALSYNAQDYHETTGANSLNRSRQPPFQAVMAAERDNQPAVTTSSRLRQHRQFEGMQPLLEEELNERLMTAAMANDGRSGHLTPSTVGLVISPGDASCSNRSKQQWQQNKENMSRQMLEVARSNVATGSNNEPQSMKDTIESYRRTKNMLKDLTNSMKPKVRVQGNTTKNHSRSNGSLLMQDPAEKSEQLVKKIQRDITDIQRTIDSSNARDMPMTFDRQ